MKINVYHDFDGSGESSVLTIEGLQMEEMNKVIAFARDIKNVESTPFDRVVADVQRLARQDSMYRSTPYISLIKACRTMMKLDLRGAKQWVDVNFPEYVPERNPQ